MVRDIFNLELQMNFIKAAYPLSNFELKQAVLIATLHVFEVLFAVFAVQNLMVDSGKCQTSFLKNK